MKALCLKVFATQPMQPVSQLSSTALAGTPPPRIKQEIVAIHNPALVEAPPASSQVLLLPQPSTSSTVAENGVDGWGN